MKLKLKNFRGIKEGSIELGKLTILIGANNSGKTTLLEALFLLPNPLRIVPYTTDGGRRKPVEILSVRHSTLGCEAYIFLYHNYSGREAKISLLSRDSKVAELMFEREGNWIRVFMMGKKGIWFLGMLSAISTGIRPEERLRTTTFNERGKLVPSASVVDILTEHYVSEDVGEVLYLHPRIIPFAWNFLRGVWVELRAAGLTARIAERVSEWVSGDYDDLLLEPFTGGRYTIYLRSRDGRGVRLGDVGDGLQFATTLMLLYEYAKPRILAIDDVESHVNPTLLKNLTQWIGEVLDRGTRVVLSTHSLEVVKVMAGVLEDYEPKIVLTSLHNGILRKKDLTLEEVERLEKAGVDVRLAEGIIL